jgi:alkanesulfonate monooxygenase SsuD/methylene tetrahydromethanopterin reductase-like flavin-dependent oxidoreductase (luciferase family)
MASGSDSGQFADHSLERGKGRALSSPNRLKLGVFGANLSGGVSGITMVKGPPRIANWAEAKGIAVAADEAGFEAMVPVARWKGYGAPSLYWDRCLETFTWGAGIAEATKQIQVFTTCHVPLFHPVMAAKMGATVDHIANGRWGLNVVAGWLGTEFKMFGQELAPHDVRYALAEEWIEVVKRLWIEDEEFDLDGDYFKVEGGLSEPKPVQRPLPAIMNAGISPAGQQFAVKNADMIFINLGDQAGLVETVASIREAAAKDDREVAIWGNAHIVCRPTEREVHQFVTDYVETHGDYEGARRFAASMVGGDSTTAKVWEADTELLRNLVATSGNGPIVGTPEQVVEQMRDLSDLGIDGLNLAWVDYEEGISQYSAELLPLMREAGLRQDEMPVSLST